MSVHPGVIKTNLYRSTGLKGGFVGAFFDFFFTDKTIPQGASTTLWAALAPNAGENNARGAYCADCNILVPSTYAQDKYGKLREALWEETFKQLREATGDALNV